MCGIGIVVSGARIEWHPASIPGCPADGFAPRLARHAPAELCAPVPASRLRTRGPDGAETLTLPLSLGAIHMTASVLAIRGPAPVRQPLVSSTTNDVLSWNGEIFGGVDTDGEDESDSHALLRALELSQSPCDVVERLRGPWSIAYWRSRDRTLWFGRDAIGRRSLLVARTPEGLALCSVAIPLAELCAAEEGAPVADAAAQELGSDSAGRLAALDSEAALGTDTSDVLRAQLAADWQEVPPLAAGGLWCLRLEEDEAGEHACQPRFVVRPCAPQAQSRANSLCPPPCLSDDGESCSQSQAESSSQSCANSSSDHDRAAAAAAGAAPLSQSALSPATSITTASEARAALYLALSEAVRVRVQMIGQSASAGAGADAAGEGCGEESARAARRGAAAVSHGGEAASAAAHAGDGSACAKQMMDSGSDSSPGVGGSEEASRARATVAVLFSGGIDSMVLAILAHKHLPPGLPIELVNVAFKPPASARQADASGRARDAPSPALASTATTDDWRGGEEAGRSAGAEAQGRSSLGAEESVAPDRISALLGLDELRRAAPHRKWLLVLADVTVEELASARANIERLISPAETVMDFNIGAALWFGARARGTLYEEPVDTGIFGAGLLSTDEGELGGKTEMLARPAGVGSTREQSAQSKRAGAARVPSRAEPLCRYAPLVSSDPRPSAAPQRHPHHPVGLECGVELTISVGVGQTLSLRIVRGGELASESSALQTSDEGNLAPRACQPNPPTHSRAVAHQTHGLPYVCTARVFLIGTGADEQFAGYGRHRTTFLRRGPAALAAELHADVSRLWVRNLGRDDRVIADCSREARHPFLDEGVLAVARACAAGTLFNLELPLGVGDKQALREIGALLGLGASTRLQKRAIQFGTRLANKKVSGTALLSGTLTVADLVYRGDGVPQPQLGADVRKQRRPAWKHTVAC